jgi:DNA-binding transcriptional MerR regulator
MKSEFLHRDLMKIFPTIKPRTIISWAERRLIEPDIRDASGRGSSRRYSYENLIEIAFISELASLELPFARIKHVVRSEKFREIVKKHKWDQVLCIAHDPSQKERHEKKISVYSVADFLRDGGEYLLGHFRDKGGRPISSVLTSSALIVNVDALNKKLTQKIEDLGE